MKKVKVKLSREARNAQLAMRRAVRRIIAEHRISGDPLYIWRDGKVVKLDLTKPPRPKRKKSPPKPRR